MMLMEIFKPSIKSISSSIKGYNKSINLTQLLEQYCVEEMKNIYIYLPLPKKTSDSEAWALLNVIHLVNAVRGGPYRLHASNRPKWLRKMNPHLFTNDPCFFLVYRIDRNKIEPLFDLLEELSCRSEFEDPSSFGSQIEQNE